MPLPAGTKLDGYEVLGLLGSGGMGEVYRARDPVLKREVAIKVLPPFVSGDPDRLRRFEQEAQATAALNHPNILAVYHFGVGAGSPYLVSELLVGETLRQLLERGPLAVRKAIDCGMQIAHGLAAAHDKGIVHRDLKPENLFVTKEGRIKILDFGLAKLIQRGPVAEGSDPTLTHGTEPGLAMGTAGYMSPEQVRGTTVDHRADIFAYGAILYEMLTGRRAFQRSTSAETMTAILNDPPPAVSQTTQNVPPGLQRVVYRCLEKNPEQRFQSASDLAFALESLSESGLSSAVPLGATGQRPRRKLSGWAALAGLVTVAAVAAFFVVREERAPALRIAGYTQITHDGHAGEVFGSDGSRLYLQSGLGDPISQVAVSGGEIEPVTSVSLPRPVLNDVSPDGSAFLAQSYAAGPSSVAPLYSVQILGGQQRYLANAGAAQWSSDGKSVLYIAADGEFHIMRSDGSDDRKVGHVTGPPDSFCWSPDGKTIRFTVNSAFWEMSVDGSNPHPLLAGWRMSHSNRCAGWSPDGSLFFISSASQIWARSERQTLLRRPSPLPVQLTTGPIRWGNPVISKDGKTIFAAGYTPHGELNRLDNRSGAFQPYLGGLSADLLSFSKDGHTVAWVTYPEGVLWVARSDGSQRVQLTDSPLYPESICLSPDGTQVLFMAPSSQGRREAWIVSAQGGSPRRLFPADPSGQQTDPRWSPDGSKIIFASGMVGDTNKDSLIRVLDVASHQVSTLPGSSGMFSPLWSPDGKSIVASALNVSTFYLFDVRTQHWSAIYKGLLGYIAWSSDSRSIYGFQFADNPAILRIPIAGGKPAVVADLKNFRFTGTLGLWFGLDPTDAPLLLRSVGTSDVYALALEEK
jgi:Tol biopolymer transport system component